MQGTTITLPPNVKDAGRDEAKRLGLRGRFSEYIELLIKADLKSKGIDYEKKSI